MPTNSVRPRPWKVAAARIRMLALMKTAKLNATTMSATERRIASRSPASLRV